MSESTLAFTVRVSLLASPISTEPVNVPLVPLIAPEKVPVVPEIAPADTKLPTFNCPETSPAPFMSSEPPSISPLAVIVVAPVIEPLIAKLLPPVIVDPTKSFLVITAPPSVLKEVV